MRWFKALTRGMASIFRGMSTFNIMPSQPPRRPKYKLLSHEEVEQELTQALRDDWEQVGTDMKKVISANPPPSRPDPYQ